jgi:ribosomal protein S18 acetylase RimI-like enzyme
VGTPPRGGRITITQVRTKPQARALDIVDIEVWGSPNPKKHRHYEFFLGAGSRVFRIDCGGKLAGGIAVSDDSVGDLMHLEEIAVRPAFQHLGVGHAAIRFVRRLARKLGYAGVAAEVDATNAKAMRWYRRRGFKRVGYVITDNESAWAREERPHLTR